MNSPLGLWYNARVRQESFRTDRICRRASFLLLSLLLSSCSTTSPDAVAMTPRRMAELEEARQVRDDRNGHPTERERTIPAGEGLFVESATPAPAFRTPEQARYYYTGTYPDLARRYFRSLSATGQASDLPQHQRLKLIAYTEDGTLVCVEQAEGGERRWTSMKQLLNNTEDPSAAETADAIAGAAAFGASLALISPDGESRDTAPTSPAAAMISLEAVPISPAAASSSAAAGDESQGAAATAPAAPVAPVATPAISPAVTPEHLEPAL